MTQTRSPAVAGQFYAGSEAALREQIESAFEHAIGPGTIPSEAAGMDLPNGLVSPHAGYPYSGPVAAHGFSRLAKGGRPSAAIIIGPNHSGHGEPIAISEAEAWETPLGTVPVHDGIRWDLSDEYGLSLDEATHGAEHSLEVQVPFLQYLYEEPVPIVPIVMTRQDSARVRQLATALTRVLEKWDSVVLIASTDLTHYESASRAKKLDTRIREAIEGMEAEAILEAAESGHTMCGPGPTATVLKATKAAGATDASVLQYATSGDTAGGTDSVVGYVSATIE